MNALIVKSRWVFKLKTNSDGSVSKYKARLVAKGYSQTQGVDYFETFAPVVRFDTIRFLTAHAATKGWQIHQMDVKSAFLNGVLSETIFMEVPEGYENPKNQVVKLNKCLYGLKQAARVWNQDFTSKLDSHGLYQSSADPCLFINESKSIMIAVYVDDCFITGIPEHISKCKQILSKEFEMTDLGLMKYLLGIQVNQSPGRIELSQQAYTEKILQKFKMDASNPIDSPQPYQPSSSDLEPLASNIPYRSHRFSHVSFSGHSS